VRTAIRKHLRDFIAIIALFVVAAVVGGVILTNQRLTLPGWVPVIGKDFYEVKAEFTTAQAVTPGQGQTVNVAGVEIGEISKVELDDGKGVVTLRIEEEHRPIFRDATALLRPKTGLKDMTVELVPGTRRAGALPEGGRIPVSNTLPDVNLDEILSSLDADTRAYLQLLIGNAEEGLRGNGRELANVLRRFEPLARDLRRVNEDLAERRGNIKRVIHNTSLLMEELGARDEEVARFVETSSKVFESLSSEDENIRATLRELPSALQETRTALASAETLAGELGPSLSALRPAARALGPALRDTRPFLRESTPIIRDELRPFARDIQPAVSELRPALRGLAGATPELDTSFEVLNRFLNTLAYNPPGERDEGYLFWNAWAAHLAPTAFGTQDAHGPIRRGEVVLTCSSLAVLDNVAAVNPLLGTLVGLLNPPRSACPQSPAASPAPSGPPPTGENPAGAGG
jgi:phospholipid/cholesterol/gamma-HCH transport system substrate-binding protein